MFQYPTLMIGWVLVCIILFFGVACNALNTVEFLRGPFGIEFLPNESNNSLIYDIRIQATSPGQHLILSLHPDTNESLAFIYILSNNINSFSTAHWNGSWSQFSPEITGARAWLDSQDLNDYPSNYLPNLLRFSVKLNLTEWNICESDLLFLNLRMNSTVPHGVQDLDPFGKYSVDSWISFRLNDTFHERVKRPYARYEVLHISLWITSMCILLIIGLLLCIFAPFQPLKSRGVIPFANWLTQFLCLGAQVSLFWVNLEEMTNLCPMFGLIETSGTVSLLLLIPMFLFRFVTILHLNIIKERVISLRNQDHDQQVSRLFRFLKIVSHPLVLVLWWFILYLVQAVIWFTQFAVAGWQCKYMDSSIDDYQSLGFYILAIFLLFLCVIYDFILNFGKIKLLLTDCKNFRKNLENLLADDIFYIRFELIIFLPFVALVNIISIVVTGTSISVFNSLSYVGLFLCQNVYPLIMTWIGLCRRTRRYNHDVSNRLKFVLSHQEGIKMLTNQCKKEWSSENLSSYLDIQEYNALTSEKARERTAVMLRQRYLIPNVSELEINIDGISRNAFVKKWQKNEYVGLFLEIENVVLENLKDPMSRLESSTEFQTWMEITKMKIGM